MAPDRDEVAETVAYVGVRRTQSRYADIVTRRSWSELPDIMEAGCVLDLELVDRSLSFEGPEAIGDFIGHQLEQFSFFEFVILNTVVDVDAAAGTAVARMYMAELRQQVGDGRRTNAYGVYHDRFLRGDDRRWRFARRRYSTYSRTADAAAPHDQDVGALPVVPLDELWSDG